MNLIITGLGTALPAEQIAQADAAELVTTFMAADARRKTFIDRVFRGSRVRQRGSVLLEHSNGNGPQQSFYPPAANGEDRGPTTGDRMRCYAEHAVPLANQAAAAALADAGVAAQEITHLITVSCTGFFAPGLDEALTRRLGLQPEVGRLQVGFMGCHGVFNALRAAEAFVRADNRARVLICAVELCSLHYQYGGVEGDKLVANALFADGAAAVVAESTTQHPGGNSGRWKLAALGSYLDVRGAQDMTWVIGNHGFEMTLSRRVPGLIGEQFCPWFESWLSRQGYRVEDMGCWAVHPGGPRILAAVAGSLKLPPEALRSSEEVLARYGNMSSPTILFVLEELAHSGVELPCAAMAFGPGLVMEVALFA